MQKNILEYQKTAESPYVYFDAQKGIFKIEGRSTIENDTHFFNFYIPMIKYLKNYENEPISESRFYFDIEYLDERSNNFYFDIFGKIEELQKVTRVVVIWHFENEEQEEQGEDFLAHFDLVMEFIQK